MITSNQVYAIAKQHLNHKGSHARAFCGLESGQPYCCAYVTMCMHKAGGAKLFYGGQKVTYCPAALKWCQANLAQVPPYLAMRMDFIFFDWQPNGTPDHIGFVLDKISTDKIRTLEGNTSGGIVAIKTRGGYIQGIFRPHYAPEKMPVKKALEIDGDFGFNSIYMLQVALGVKADAVLGKVTVKALQRKVGATPDGFWGEKTSKNIQRKLCGFKGKAVDGDFGPQSVRALQKWINAKVYPVEPQRPVTVVKPTASTLGKCIDVSYWQAKISLSNWEKIKESCDYAICRASFTRLQKTFELGEDSTFVNNVTKSRQAGFKAVGSYHYSQALTVEEAKKEANYLCDILDKYEIDFWVACDYETNKKGRLTASVLKKKVGTKASDIVNAFCEEVEKRGYKACIYANYDTLTKYIKNPKYPVWVAQYPKGTVKSTDKSAYKEAHVMWQYTSKGRVDGITAKNTNNKSANVDLSYVYALPKPITPKPTTPTVEKKTYTETFPSLNNNTKIVNGMAYRMCYPYGTPQNKYTYKDGEPTEAYKKGIDKVYPNHKEWSNKRQKVGACCDVFVGVALGLVGISVKKDLKNQLVDMPKMTTKLKSNGHYLAKDFKLGDVVQRGRKDKSGHTWIVCELVNGKKFIANAHYKHLDGCYAVMDAVPKNIVKSKWAYYKCYAVLGAIRTYYQKGDYGYDVLYIQKFLKWYGYSLSADGDFGDNTEKYVKAFQKATGLEIDGKVGSATIAKMKTIKK